MFVYRKIEQFDFKLYLDSPRPVAKKQKEAEAEDEERMLNSLKSAMTEMRSFNQQMNNGIRRLNNEFENLLTKY